MDVESDLLRDAARLIACALEPERRPTNDPEYNRLIRLWHDEPLFERVARDIAAGLGLRIIDVSEFGATIGAHPESPFGLTVADYRQNLSSEERLIHGLVQVGLAAFLYPRVEDLESEAEIRTASVVELESFLRETCEQLAAHARESDPPADAPELERAWRAYLRWPATRETSDARRAAKTTSGVIAHALGRLADLGLLRRVNEDGGGTYQALRRYRVQVRELALHDALQALRQAREG
jgi:hypothetical protein